MYYSTMARQLLEKSAGRPICPFADFDLINPKHMLNAYKLKAGSITLFISFNDWFICIIKNLNKSANSYLDLF